jgi:hypothetical protein
MPLPLRVSGTTGGDGWIALILFLPAVFLCVIGSKAKPIRGGKRLGLVIPALLASAIGLWKIVAIGDLNQGAKLGGSLAYGLSGGQVDPDVFRFKIGVGLYLVTAAGVAVAFLGWFLDKQRQNSGLTPYTASTPTMTATHNPTHSVTAVPNPPVVSSPDMIHITRGGQKYGPYSSEQTRAMLASGQLSVSDQAWYEGAPGWMPLNQVPGIA